MSKRKRSRQRRAAASARAPAAKSAAPAAAAPAPARQAKAPRRQAPQARTRAVAAPAGAEPFERLALLGAGAAGLIAFVVYVLTVDPSVPTGDSGELIAAAYVLGLPHPPGYPLYMMLGHLATLLPGGSPALRMNLLSALFDAVAVALVFLVVHRLVAGRREAAPRRDWAPLAAGAVGALLLAFSSLFWAYSVVAEVFALNNLFAAALLLVALEWARRPDRVRLLWLFMLLLGLALTNQQTIVLFVPAFLVLAWQGWTTLRRDGAARPSVRDLGIAVGALVAGLLPYLYLPLAAGTHPSMNWGDPTTFGRFVTDVTRGNYGSTSLVVGGKRGSILENMKLLFGDLTWGFVLVGVVLAVLGLWWSWRHRRLPGLALLTAFVVAGPAFQAYTDTAYPDQLTEGVVARFYILPSIPLAIAAGLGVWWVLQHAGRLRVPGLRPGLVSVAAAGALLCAPVASAVAHYGAQDQSGNYVAYHYARDLLGNLAPDALLLMRSDENYTSVSYAQNVEHFRPDVIALDSELLKLPSYVAQARREHPSLLVPFDAYDGGVHTSLNSFVKANLSRRPVYYVGVQEEKKFGKPFDQLKEGLSTRLVPKGTAPDAYSVLAEDPARFAALHYPSRLYPRTSWEAAIGRVYAYAAFFVGYAIQTDGTKAQVPLAEKMYRTAIRLFPGLAPAYKDLGLMLHDNGGDPKEIIAVWEKFLQLKPNDPQAPAIRSVLATLKGKQ